MNAKARYLLVLWIEVALVCSGNIYGQDVRRPQIWGIAKMTFLVSDMEKANAYYGQFLGFDKAFSYPSSIGTVVSFKVNDRQFLEFVSDAKAADKDRLVSLSLETSSAEQMRLYLRSQGVKTPEHTTIDGAGNEVFSVADNDGNPIEFISFKAEGLHRIEHYAPNTKDISHPCLLVEDMQETIYTLKERATDFRPARPAIGKGNRWILNLRDADGNRTEFTEAHRIR